MRKFNLISGAIWIILAILILFESIQLGIGKLNYPEAGMFPFLTAILLGLVSVVLIFEILRHKSVAEEGKTVGEKDINWKNIIFAILILIIYTLILESVGYILATFALMIILFNRFGMKRWFTVIFSSIITVVLSFVVFALWLQVQLPEGMLARMMR